MATLGEAYVNIAVDSSGLTKGLADAQGKVSKSADAMAAKLAGIGKGMAIAGGVITGALALIVTKTAAAGDQFDKMSLRTGVSVEALSALAYAADICGTDIGTVEKGLKGLTKGMADAEKGVGLAKDAFEELGISVVDAEGNLRPTVEVLKEAATKIAAIENPTKQAALAMDIFGAKAGPQLLPLLKQGGAGIEELMKKADALGITMSTEAATAAAEFTDRLTDLKGSLAGAGREIGNVLIPAITPLIEKITEIVGKVKNWVEEHKPLVETIVKFVAAAGVIMVVLGPILIAIPLLIKAFAGLKLAIVGIKIAMTAMTGPVGIIILAVGALYLAWTTNFGGIRDFTIAVVEKVKEALGWLWDKVKWVLEKLGLYKETAEEVTKANAELAIATKEAGEKAATAAIKIDILTDSMDGLGEKTEKAYKIMDEFGNFLESFDDWVERLANEEKQRQEGITKKLEEEAEKRKTILEKFADTQKSIADRIYELTHTAMEIAIKKLDEEKQSYIDLGMSIEEVNSWYDFEIAKLNESNQIKDITIDKNIGIAESIEPIIEKTKEVGEVTKVVAEQIAGSFTVVRRTIDMTTQALSNFSKEGVAAAIATIKMKFLPLIAQAVKDLNWARTHFSRFWGYQQTALDNLVNAMNSAIDNAKLGFDVYNEELTKLGGTTENLATQTYNFGGSIISTWNRVTKAIEETVEAAEDAIDVLTAPGIWGMGSSSGGSAGGGGSFPSYKHGTTYVPKTSLAVVHRGEEINPPGQRSYDNRKSSYSPTININNPIVRNDNDIYEIRRVVDQVLKENVRQYDRRGKELALGMG